jgi:hypothetical protein
MNAEALKALFSTESASDLITLVTFTDENTVQATAIISGNTYVITSTGSTLFTTIGSSSNDVGTVFVATGAGSGSGTVNLVILLSDSYTGVYSSVATSATTMVAGRTYKIAAPGNTVWTNFGSNSSTVNTSFIATGSGSGTGTVYSYSERISETSTDVTYGVISRGRKHTFLPLEITLPQEDEAQAPRCSIVIRDVTRYITPVIRNLTRPPKVLLELVLSTTPDLVEVSFDGFYVTNFTYNRDQVTCELQMVNYEREPFPMHSFSPKYFPGLF